MSKKPNKAPPPPPPPQQKVYNQIKHPPPPPPPPPHEKRYVICDKKLLYQEEHVISQSHESLLPTKLTHQSKEGMPCAKQLLVSSNQDFKDSGSAFILVKWRDGFAPKTQSYTAGDVHLHNTLNLIQILCPHTTTPPTTNKQNKKLKKYNQPTSASKMKTQHQHMMHLPLVEKIYPCVHCYESPFFTFYSSIKLNGS